MKQAPAHRAYLMALPAKFQGGLPEQHEEVVRDGADTDTADNSRAIMHFQLNREK